ncbi:MAG: acetyl-CoA C-acetyltransferase [Thermomicrobiales bacterium]|nr:acetyl-CoA C-acetyltransferase [Thermomicrobiales bacterium]
MRLVSTYRQPTSVILGGARTPFGRLNGALASRRAVDLGARALAAALERSSIDPADIENVIMGQVLQGGAGQNPARQVALLAGLDRTVPAETINRVCGSGMRAIALADALIRAGDYQVVAAGGMESMSQAPYIVRQARTGYRMGNGVFEDMMIGDGLSCAIAGCHMGIHGGAVAAEEGVSREEQDAWALRSHQRAIAAQQAGWLSEEIVPVEIVDRTGATVVDRDEAPRRDTSMEALARLKPVFDPNHSVTAGNAPGVNDGAAAAIVADAAWAADRGLIPAATILAQGAAAWDPPYLAYTPAMASEKALAKADLTPTDVDLWEINEAFASVPLISAQRLGIDLERVNVNGGAVALGHPIGASGARIVLTLIHELRRRGGGIGVAAICSGGGGGDAVVVRVEGGVRP